ncbi:MAG: hypothetical protein JNN13_09605 [Planctomycetes bacterium]|nr:hypothetical protein [Planctomycetota bacterium]
MEGEAVTRRPFHGAPAVLLPFAALLLAAAAPAQKDKTPEWLLDPYTKNDPKLMEKAGYVGFGPFQFGNIAERPVQNTDIQKSLEFVQIRWVETKHFRIGLNLPAWKIPEEAGTKKKIRAELEELQQKLPSVNPKTRTLDPWLRVHLTAQRLENLYAQTMELFGVTDASFPPDPANVIKTPGAVYMGFGPYLGMKDKFLVLVFEKGAVYQQYMKAYLGRDTQHPQRWHFKESSMLLFTMATEDDLFPKKHDTALHCGLAFNVSQNLLDGFRYYGYNLPVWIREGFGHWNWRRIDANWPSYDQDEGSVADMKVVPRWEPYCRALVANGKFTAFAEAAKWRSFGDIKFDDHVAVWSRIDWLIAQGPEQWRKFLFAVKGRTDDNWGPDQSDLVGAVRDALKDAYGLSVLDIDSKWAEWVKTNYPAQ